MATCLPAGTAKTGCSMTPSSNPAENCASGDICVCGDGTTGVACAEKTACFQACDQYAENPGCPGGTKCDPLGITNGPGLGYCH